MASDIHPSKFHIVVKNLFGGIAVYDYTNNDQFMISCVDATPENLVLVENVYRYGGRQAVAKIGSMCSLEPWIVSNGKA